MAEINELKVKCAERFTKLEEKIEAIIIKMADISQAIFPIRLLNFIKED